MPNRRTLAIAGYYAAAVFGSLVIYGGSAIVILRHATLQTPSTAWMLAGGYSVAMAWALGFIWLYWRRLDEAAREAQKFAWFVGSNLAIVLTAPVMLLFRLGQLPLPRSEMPGVYFALGWASLMGAQFLGFLIAWPAWWWAKR